MATQAEIDDLKRKLNEHRAQLLHVDNLLAKSPTDTTLRKLRDDLYQVVTMTEDLASSKPSQPTSTLSTNGTNIAKNSKPTSLSSSSSSSPETKQGKASSPTSITAPVNEATITSRGTTDHDDDDEEDDSREQKMKWKVGNRCRALWDDGKWYSARIDSISESNKYLVTYLKYGNTAEVTELSLRPWIPAPKASLIKGAHVMAVYREDGLLYEAVIEDVLPDNVFKIKFTDYANVEEISGDDLLQKKVSTKNPNEIADQVVIPDNLKILPSDSDKVKDTKRKKIKRLKYQHHQKKIEQESNKRKSNWQDFQKGVKKGKAKRSIFASPESVDGKVGVTGSGKEMTKYNELKKHKFASDANAPTTQENEELMDGDQSS